MLALQESTEVIRPAAFAPEQSAALIVRALREHDVARGGVWRATVAHWERYDRPWDAPDNPGLAILLGAISVMYDKPWKHQIVVYRVRTTVAGLTNGWNAELLVDDAMSFAGLSLQTCPRTEFDPPPVADPFRRRAGAAMPVVDLPPPPGAGTAEPVGANANGARTEWVAPSPDVHHWGHEPAAAAVAQAAVVYAAPVIEEVIETPSGQVVGSPTARAGQSVSKPAAPVVPTSDSPFKSVDNPHRIEPAEDIWSLRLLP